MKTVLNNKYILMALSVLGAAMAPVAPLLITVGSLIGLDLFTAVWYVIKKKGFKAITSAGLSRTAAKTLLYSMIIVIGYHMEKNLLGFLVPISKVSATYLALIEFKSLLENIDLILNMNLTNEIINRLSSKNLKFPKSKPKKKR